MKGEHHMKTLLLMILCLVAIACGPKQPASDPVGSTAQALTHASENHQHNICSPPNHPAFRKYASYRNQNNGYWYTHPIDMSSATVAYKSNYTCTCQMWNPVVPGQCMMNMPSTRPPHQHDYSGCTGGSSSYCRYYMGNTGDNPPTGYILVGPGNGDL